MPRIIGVDIPGNKRVEFSLRYLYGIGPALALEIIEKVGIDRNIKAKDLTPDQIAKITKILQDDLTVIAFDLHPEVHQKREHRAQQDHQQCQQDKKPLPLMRCGLDRAGAVIAEDRVLGAAPGWVLCRRCIGMRVWLRWRCIVFQFIPTHTKMPRFCCCPAVS